VEVKKEVENNTGRRNIYTYIVRNEKDKMKGIK